MLKHGEMIVNGVLVVEGCDCNRCRGDRVRDAGLIASTAEQVRQLAIGTEPVDHLGERVIPRIERAAAGSLYRTAMSTEEMRRLALESGMVDRTGQRVIPQVEPTAPGSTFSTVMTVAEMVAKGRAIYESGIPEFDRTDDAMEERPRKPQFNEGNKIYVTSLPQGQYDTEDDEAAGLTRIVRVGESDPKKFVLALPFGKYEAQRDQSGLVHIYALPPNGEPVRTPLTGDHWPDRMDAWSRETVGAAIRREHEGTNPSGNGFQLAGAYFRGPADSNGLTEIKLRPTP
jgi:hypothetical protein